MNILLERGAVVDTENRNGSTALMLATYGGNGDFVSSLLEHGADVNHKNKNGDTALMLAAELFTVEALYILLKKGAQVDAVNNKGETALAIAKERGKERVQKIIVATLTKHVESKSE